MQTALDDRDIRILSILSREGRITKTELARRVNLSPTPCWDRLKRLEESGLITGYRAELELSKIARHVTVFVMAELEAHRAADMQRFERAAQARDWIVSCWAIGGGFDYLLETVAIDIDSYQRLMDDFLGAGVGLKRYFSYILTKKVKAAAGPPIDLLLEMQKD